jgi:hypothetical protein
MFLAHFAVAFAAKPAMPRISLGVLTDEDVLADAGGHHHLGLAQLLAADAYGALAHLHVGDLRDFVGLGVDVERDFLFAADLLHLADVFSRISRSIIMAGASRSSIVRAPERYEPAAARAAAGAQPAEVTTPASAQPGAAAHPGECAGQIRFHGSISFPADCVAPIRLAGHVQVYARRKAAQRAGAIRAAAPGLIFRCEIHPKNSEIRFSTQPV